MRQPLVVETDPTAPRQPVPAHDGGDYLKTIPGFSVIRKGGTDGDPVFRGMAGSRLNILLDGEVILGGCGNRMDPPTAYAFPESYDRVVVLKGPQTVANGPGNSAGTVRFERDFKRYAATGWRGAGSVTLGSFGRNDVVADVGGGNPDFYARAAATRSDADDYEDGDGRRVHSRYTRWSANAALGWTPDERTRIELTAARSDGEAAYGDRSMDGVRFARDNVGLKFEKRNVSPLFEKVEAQAYRNYIDHVMDNFTLRALVGNPMVGNPDRLTVGGHLSATLRIAEPTRLKLGVDWQDNLHTLRSTMNETTRPYEAMSRREDANFHNLGVFGEVEHFLNDADKLVGGLRLDRWRAQDKRATLTLGMSTVANPTADKERRDTLASGFGRYEHDFGRGATFYAGLGHSERFPDYWETISASKESRTSASAFDTRPEKTSQLDLGLVYAAGPLSASLSGFYSRIDDFILVQNNVVKTAPSRTVSIVRNVDAATWGGEAGLAYRAGDAWQLDSTLAYVRGDNRSDGTPLAQLPPLELRLGANHDNGILSAGALLRLVTEQDRVDIGKGNIVGQDIGRTPGFAVFSVNAGWRATRGVLVSAGIDNLFDRTYAEHISRAGASIVGFTQTTRINEPGRNLWVKANIRLD